MSFKGRRYDDRLICSLFLVKHKLHSILLNNSRSNMYWLEQHYTNASENHLLENTPRNTQWCEWLVFLRGS